MNPWYHLRPSFSNSILCLILKSTSACELCVFWIRSLARVSTEVFVKGSPSLARWMQNSAMRGSISHMGEIWVQIFASKPWRHLFLALALIQRLLVPQGTLCHCFFAFWKPIKFCCSIRTVTYNIRKFSWVGPSVFSILSRWFSPNLCLHPEYSNLCR